MAPSWLSSARFVIKAVGGYTAVRVVLSVAAVIVALASPSRLASEIVLGLVTVVVVAGWVVQFVRSRSGDESQFLLGDLAHPRVLIVLAALAISPLDPVTVTAAALLCALLVGERMMRRPVHSAMPQAANIPGWDVPLPSTQTSNRLFAVDTIGMVFFVISAMFGITQIPALVAAAAGLALAAVLSLQAVRFLIKRNRFEAKLPKILKEIRPAFCFHWQAPVGTAYQAAMWLPYLDRIGLPYFVLVRTAANFREVSKLTNAPVILRVGLQDLDRIVTPSLKAVFYANTAVRNSHMIRFPHLTHIQLNHGDSDKIASASPTFRQYDKNFVAGQAAIDRFAKHNVATLPEQFEIVSRPQLEHVQRATVGIDQVAQPTVLYSPTWSGFYEDSDYSSLPAGVAIVEALLARGCTVVFRPHPYARKHVANANACTAIIELLREDARQTGREHLFGPVAETEMSVIDCFNSVDAMVSDVSSLVSDFLISDKPFAMAAVSAHGDEFLDEFPLGEAAYVFDVVGADAVGFADLLSTMLGTDPQRERRRSLRSYYLGDIPRDELVNHFTSTARKFLV